MWFLGANIGIYMYFIKSGTYHDFRGLSFHVKITILEHLINLRYTSFLFSTDSVVLIKPVNYLILTHRFLYIVCSSVYLS